MIQYSLETMHTNEIRSYGTWFRKFMKHERDAYTDIQNDISQ